MLSTLTILSIFAEIFSSLVLAAGAVSFLKRYGQTKAKQDLYLSAVFSAFTLYLAGTVISQLMFNIESRVSLAMTLQRAINSMLIVGSVFVLYFAGEKAAFKWKWAYYVPVLIAGALIFTAFSSPINLIYRFDVSEPVVEFTGITLIRYFWAVSWILLAAVLLLKARVVRNLREKNLLRISGLSALSVLAGYSFYLAYLVTGSGMHLLISWIISFFSFSGFLLGNIILPEDDVSERPLNFLKTRILFKLAMIFVFMIVVLVEATSLATISISRASLSKSVVALDKQIAVSVFERANYYLRQGKSMEQTVTQLQEDIEKISFSEGRTISIVDRSGKLLVHSDPKRAAAREDMGRAEAVRELMAGRTGGGEFADEYGDRQVGAFMYSPSLRWGILVAEPVRRAYGEVRKMETSSLIFVIMGIILTVIVGMFFAKSIELPINAVISGTEQIRKGNLKYRIKTGSIDEIGRLAREFNNMTEELSESQDHLIASEKLAALGAMAAGMAHEIKNPLVALRTFTQLLPIKWEDKEFRDKFSSVVPPEIDKINKIAENLLKFGRPSKPEFKPTSVNAVLEEVLELLENQFRKNNIRVATKFVEVPMINGDQSQLSQAFLNIVLNACQAMPNGGELIVKTDVGHVIQLSNLTKEGLSQVKQLANQSSGKQVPTVFVEITDTGSGIPEDKMKNMFDPFFTTKETGTGMGLPITLRIIEEHKGSIKVRSQAGKGTTFIIILPQSAGSSDVKVNA